MHALAQCGMELFGIAIVLWNLISAIFNKLRAVPYLCMPNWEYRLIVTTHSSYKLITSSNGLRAHLSLQGKWIPEVYFHYFDSAACVRFVYRERSPETLGSSNLTVCIPYTYATCFLTYGRNDQIRRIPD